MNPGLKKEEQMNDQCKNNFIGVQKEIAYAYEKVTFFRKHMEEAKLTPGDIRSPEDFSRIPPTTKKHYRKNFPVEVLSQGYTLNDKRLVRFPSAGTTAERLLTVELGHIFMKRAIDSISIYPSLCPAFIKYPRRHIRYAAPNCSDVECANPYSRMEDRLLSDGTLVLAVYHDLLTTPAQILDQNAEELEKHQPQMYFIDPTHFAFLIRYMKAYKNGQIPPPAPVLSSYTPCIKTSRRQIVDAFGINVPFIEVVSMSELGYIAVECPLGGLHLNTKSYYIELLCQGRPAETGELAELYVTTLDNGCIPHIRYRTGDIYRLTRTDCPCGHHFPVIQIEGRLRNFLFRKNTIALTPKGLDDLIGAPAWLDLYKMKQNDENDFSFHYIVNETYEKNMENYIRDQLYQQLGTDIHLVFEKTNYIPTERSGKFLSCISKVGEKMYEEGFML